MIADRRGQKYNGRTVQRGLSHRYLVWTVSKEPEKKNPARGKPRGFPSRRVGGTIGNYSSPERTSQIIRDAPLCS